MFVTPRQRPALHCVSCASQPRPQTSGTYAVSLQQRQEFHTKGYVVLRQVLSQQELSEEIVPVYQRFLDRDIYAHGADLCDMSGAIGRTPDQYTVFNVIQSRLYHPEWQGNLFEQRCQDIADQLQGGDMVPDYDQILAKRPSSEDAIFAWHQDMAYWPVTKADPATATCWLAVSEASEAMGCMRFVPGSHKEPELRPHSPVASSRAESHALCTQLQAEDEVLHAPLQPGDISVHNERVMHGSGPNMSKDWRLGYVLAFRKSACVAEERAAGFTHSHNDVASWDAFHKHGVAAFEGAAS